MVPPVFEQTELIRVAGRVVSRGQSNRAVFAKLVALRRVKPGPDEILGEVRGGSNSHERVDSLDSRQSGQQHDPPAHARADQDLSPIGQRIDNLDRVLYPATDRPQGNVAAGRAMPEIIETHIGVSAATAVF